MAAKPETLDPKTAEPEENRFRLLAASMRHNGRLHVAGDIIELTEEQARRLARVVRKVTGHENPAVGVRPGDTLAPSDPPVVRDAVVPQATVTVPPATT